MERSRRVAEFLSSVNIMERYAQFAQFHEGVIQSVGDDRDRGVAAYMNASTTDAKAGTQESGDLETAVYFMGRAIAGMEQLVGKECREMLGFFYGHRGALLLEQSQMGADAAALNLAISDLEKSASLIPVPDVAPVYAFLGEAYRYKGDLSAAFESLDRSIEIDPNYAEAYLLAGTFHLENGNTELGRGYICDAILINPELCGDEYQHVAEEMAKWDAAWDEMLNSPESIAMLESWTKESKEARRRKE